MNDDFIKDYRREPSPEFRQALYARISPPMNAHIPSMRRLRARALAMACALAVLAAATLLTPAGRAFANQLLYQIGVVTVVEMPQGSVANDQPTAAPPSTPVPQPRAADADAASRLAGFAVLDLAALPAGYAPVEDWTVIREGQRVNAVRGYADGAGRSLTINQLKPAPGETYEQQLSPNETATPVDINGAEGLLIEGVLMGYGPIVDGRPALKPTNWLRWAAGGINYTLWADDLSAEQLVEIARGME